MRPSRPGLRLHAHPSGGRDRIPTAASFWGATRSVGAECLAVFVAQVSPTRLPRECQGVMEFVIYTLQAAGRLYYLGV